MYLPIVVLSVLLVSAKCLELESFYNYLRDDDNSSSVECAIQKAAFLQGLTNGDAWAAKSKFKLYFCTKNIVSKSSYVYTKLVLLD